MHMYIHPMHRSSCINLVSIVYVVKVHNYIYNINLSNCLSMSSLMCIRSSKGALDFQALPPRTKESNSVIEIKAKNNPNP